MALAPKDVLAPLLRRDAPNVPFCRVRSHRVASEVSREDEAVAVKVHRPNHRTLKTGHVWGRQFPKEYRA